MDSASTETANLASRYWEQKAVMRAGHVDVRCPNRGPYMENQQGYSFCQKCGKVLEIELERSDLSRVKERLHRVDAIFTRWLARYSITMLRISLGLVFLGFGAPKFFPALSPTENLVKQTLEALTYGLVPSSAGIILVATIESLVGLCLIAGRFLQIGLALLGLVMIGIVSPIFLFYQELFPRPYAPTLEGQYVLMDVVLLGAGLVVAASVRGARMVTERSALLPDWKDSSHLSRKER